VLEGDLEEGEEEEGEEEGGGSAVSAPDKLSVQTDRSNGSFPSSVSIPFNWGYACVYIHKVRAWPVNRLEEINSTEDALVLRRRITSAWTLDQQRRLDSALGSCPRREGQGARERWAAVR
jgi:hypothetical protein